MRITAVKPCPVRISTRNQMLVKIETDEGIYGWGESGFIGREIAVAGAVQHFARFLEGPATPCAAAPSGRRCTAASISRAAGP